MGERVYAVGDIHGCWNETRALLNLIKRDNEYRDKCRTHIIFLGDIIDRGPDSKRVIELLMEFPIPYADPLFIKGNHEEIVVRALTNEPNLLPRWLEYGGYECAASYGVSKAELEGRDFIAIQHMLRSAIPKQHLQFLHGFVDYVKFGDYLFTHAGIMPGVPLSKQTSRSLRWIREPFLSSERDHGLVIVHGHTISDDVVCKPNRIGLDTGAYKTGRLAAVRIEDAEVDFFCT